MKFTIDKKQILEAIRSVSGAVEKRNTIPILENVKISASNDTLSISATDLDIFITKNTPAEVIHGGETTVCAATLQDVIARLKDGDVLFDLSDGFLNVKSEKSSFKLAVLPSDDFPILDGEPDSGFQIASSELLKILRNTRSCASTEETRYYLNGVYFDFTGEKLEIVSTDGNRLCIYKTDVDTVIASFDGVIVPNKAVDLIKKILSNVEEDVFVGLSDSKLIFTAGDTRIISKLIDGTFPDYKKIIPSSHDKNSLVDPSILSDSIARVSSISDGNSNAVKFEFSDKGLNLITNGSDGNEGFDFVDTKNNFGMTIGFNARFLLDCLPLCENSETKIGLSEPFAPITIEASDNCKFVIMPLRV